MGQYPISESDLSAFKASILQYTNDRLNRETSILHGRINDLKQTIAKLRNDINELAFELDWREDD